MTKPIAGHKLGAIQMRTDQRQQVSPSLEDRVFITGGSGFIGTNLVERLNAHQVPLRSYDLRPPQNDQHRPLHIRGNILDESALAASMKSFQPTIVIHLAARTDLDAAATLEDYSANTVGVSNVISAIGEAGTVRQAIFASTKLVCPNGHLPNSMDEYSPDTTYGKSKVIGEQLVKAAGDFCRTWSIVRPTSIWGPWCEIPYGRFFSMVVRGYYFNPGSHSPKRSFGYVGNVLEQLFSIVRNGSVAHRQTFYLSDYQVTTVASWADEIARQAHGRRVRSIPEPIVEFAARSGDLLQRLGWKDVPLTTFRLGNMRKDTSRVPLESIQEVCPELPYSLSDGVAETLAWLKRHGSRRIPI